MLTADSSPELPPGDVPQVPVRRRVALPQPNFWFAILACGGYLGTMALCSTIASFLSVGISLVLSDDPSSGFETLWKSILSPGSSPLVQRAMLFGVLASHLGTLALALFCFRMIHGRHWPQLYGLHRPHFWHLLIALLVAPGLMLLHAAFHDFLAWTFNTNVGAANEEMRMWLDPWPLWVVVLALGIGPGVIEELWCRGFLGRGLLARYGWTWGVVLTSILFGLMHADLLYAVGTALMGAALHLAYLLTRCLWIPIVLHVANNTLTVMNLIPAESVSNPTPQESGLAPFPILCALMLAISGGWAFWSCRATTGPPAEDGPPAFRRRTPRLAPMLLMMLSLLALRLSIRSA
jgi:membrane protease YdiL (CAAX protease family)